MAQHRSLFKHPTSDLHHKYRRFMEISLTITLLLLIGIFYAFKNFKIKLPTLRADFLPPIEVEEIPRTDIPQHAPTPQLPSIPVPSEDPDFPDWETIPRADFGTIPSLEATIPEPEVEEIYRFIKVQQKPKIIKKVRPTYPEIARQLHVEGLVVVEVLINTKGEPEEIRVVKSIPMLDNTAIEAVRQFKFRPGKQRERLVKVWMTIPFRFSLK